MFRSLPPSLLGVPTAQHYEEQLYTNDPDFKESESRMQSTLERIEKLRLAAATAGNWLTFGKAYHGYQRDKESEKHFTFAEPSKKEGLPTLKMSQLQKLELHNSETNG